jgi:hypothetical protein
MGGANLLGNPIAPSFSDGKRLLQFTENVLMAYDESLPPGERFNFEPLGLSFQVQDQGLPVSGEQPNIRYLNGHIIFADFVPLFDQLGGVRFVGNPLTEVRLNTEKSRYEQYFEKMGFYRTLDNNQVHLLPYGLAACRQTQSQLGCQSNIPDAIIESSEYLPQPFLSTVEQLGEKFTGAPLSQPYLATDGRLEQIYENVVLAVDPNDMSTVSLRDLPLRIGLTPQPLAVPSTDELMVFLQLDPNDISLGHNIPRPFLEYVAMHGGTELSGPPISELYEENGIRRQCFTNYCLDYDPAAPREAQIHLAPLGYLYQSAQTYSTADFNLRVWETDAVITGGQEQVVGVMVYNGTPNQPMKDVQPTLSLTLPGGENQSMVFPPTSAGGTSYLNINLPQVRAGATVTYEVCASQPGATPVCVKESWLVR